MKYYEQVILALTLGTIVTACDAIFPSAPQEDQLLDGPVAGLTASQSRTFLRGDVAFNDLIFTTQTGLGPTFVSNSCGSCHAGDGKGHPTTSLVRFGQRDESGNSFLNLGGPQLQNRSIPGFSPEVLPAGAPHATFLPPANTGLGYLDFVTDASILSHADPNDADGDGISGRPNWIAIAPFVTLRANAEIQGGMVIGRYGKKASTYDLLQQTVNALSQDIGIASEFAPFDVFSGLAIEPEIATQTIHDIVFYLQTLKAPIQRTPSDATVLAGKRTFSDIGCGACHVPSLMTGPAPVDALSNTEFHPYTDLLLHDMGPGLDDGYTEGIAASNEWKTPALWGLGLSSRSQGGEIFLLHDGRARSIDEAIRMHGGEAERSRDLFKALQDSDRAALITFLESL
ncbi:MAG: thiol oxidoreductase [Ignavibacteria bacterium]|nr:thiol oxidoreductase [Ignavibacteria bacterium]